MKTTFLGTAAGRPTPKRNVTSIAVEMDNSKIILVDCGEATLHQFMKSNLKISNIHTILITHLHGDHIYGLPGLCCTLCDVRTEPLHIYGPRGLSKYCDIFTKSVYYNLVVHEIAGDFVDVTTLKIDPFSYFIEACHVKHTTECYAYSITKTRTRPKINIDILQPVLDDNKKAIEAMGIKPINKIINHLMKDKTVFIPGPNIHLNLIDYIKDDSEFKLVIAMDNFNCDNIIKYFRTCNVLIHESTFNIITGMTPSEISALTQMAITRGHSTNKMAAENARKLGCANLILTHFSNRYEINEDGIMKDEDAIITTCHETGYIGTIHIAYDFKTFDIK